MSDFKWTLSRPGISLEFETGSIKEAIGVLEQEGTQIQEIFGWIPGGAGPGQQNETPAPAAEKPAGQRGRPRNKAPVEAVAPDPLPVPTAAPTAAAMPMPSPIAPPVLQQQVEQAAASGAIPDFLKADAAPPPLPVASAPPTAPVSPTVAAPPPVGVLGPKVVAALDKHREGKPDGGQALADWLADSGLTIKGKSYDDACRAVLMISDEKLKGVAAMLGVAA